MKKVITILFILICCKVSAQHNPDPTRFAFLNTADMANSVGTPNLRSIAHSLISHNGQQTYIGDFVWIDTCTAIAVRDYIIRPSGATVGAWVRTNLPNHEIVETLDDRDSIPIFLRKVNMIVEVTALDSIYRLKGGFSNESWVGEYRKDKCGWEQAFEARIARTGTQESDAQITWNGLHYFNREARFSKSIVLDSAAKVQGIRINNKSDDTLNSEYLKIAEDSKFTRHYNIGTYTMGTGVIPSLEINTDKYVSIRLDPRQDSGYLLYTSFLRAQPNFNKTGFVGYKAKLISGLILQRFVTMTVNSYNTSIGGFAVLTLNATDSGASGTGKRYLVAFLKDSLTNQGYVDWNGLGSFHGGVKIGNTQPAGTGDSILTKKSSDTTTTSLSLEAGANVTLTRTTGKILINSTATGAAIDSAAGTYAGALAWTGTTAPTTITSQNYKWYRVGKEVSLNIAVRYTNPGSALTIVTATLPAGAPVPYIPSGFTAQDAFLPCTAVGTTGNGVTSSTFSSVTSRLRVDATLSNAYLYGTFGATNSSYLLIEVHYLTN